MRFAHETPHGTVFVDVVHAFEESDGSLPSMPAVRVSTGNGELTIRGRKYTMDFVLKRYPGGSFGRETQRDAFKGFRNERRLPVGSPMFDRLAALEDEALAAFAEAHPHWAYESYRLLDECNLAKAEDEVFRLARELEGAQARVAALRIKLLVICKHCGERLWFEREATGQPQEWRSRNGKTTCADGKTHEVTA